MQFPTPQIGLYPIYDYHPFFLKPGFEKRFALDQSVYLLLLYFLHFLMRQPLRLFIYGNSMRKILLLPLTHKLIVIFRDLLLAKCIGHDMYTGYSRVEQSLKQFFCQNSLYNFHNADLLYSQNPKIIPGSISF